MLAKVATLNNQMPESYKAIDMSEFFCEDSPTFCENNYPALFSIKTKKKKRKRERETKLDELIEQNPTKIGGYTRKKIDHNLSENFTPANFQSKDKDIKLPNPHVFP
jgi:hypothetical protein